MAFNLFGFQFPKDKTKEKEEKRKESFIPPSFDDGAINVETVSAYGAYFNQVVDIDGTYKSDNELILRYRSMALHPEVDTAIEEITNEALIVNQIDPPVKLILDKANYLNKNTKKLIEDEFNNILNLLEFNTKGFEYFRRWYTDARLYFHTIIDENDSKKGISEIRFIDPINIKKIRNFSKEKNSQGIDVVKNVEEYYLYSKNGFSSSLSANLGADSTTAMTGQKISPDVITYITSGLFDPQKKSIYGYLHKAIRPINQLRMMEDSVVIYRLARAPERRVFYIDVGSMPKAKADSYMKELINKYRNRISYNSATGEINDERRYLSVLEDFWLPRREGGKGTQIDTLQGASNLGTMDDISYFLKKVCKALNIPYSRIENEQKSFQIGKTTEITRDELKFSKFIARLRNKFSELFYELLKKQLLLKEIIKEEDWNELRQYMYFDYLKDMYFAELKELEIQNEKMEALSNIEPHIGTFYSRSWVRKNILRQTDTEIESINKEINQEKQEIEKEKEQDRIKQQELNQILNPNPFDPNNTNNPNNQDNLENNIDPNQENFDKNEISNTETKNTINNKIPIKNKKKFKDIPRL